MKTLAFCSFKGGTGKTTLSLNIGSNLAQISKKKVLLVDLDPQANLTTGLGIQIRDEHSLNEILRSSNDVRQTIHKTKIENLDIIPSSVLVEDFRGLNKDVSLSVNHLCLALQSIQNQYDVCILDTPPSLGILTQEAFLASQYLVVCLTPEPFSILGLQKIKEFCSTIANDLDVLGIVFFACGSRSTSKPNYRSWNSDS
ncbi:ParA family protein [Chlamydia caviae]|uniref:ParA family protein n=1 Tax=Chlamydia caviae TaxID=83557 RepID=UPI001EE26A67|nr:AAA family ATPase [Chlamydia caviae]